MNFPLEAILALVALILIYIGIIWLAHILEPDWGKK